MRIAFGIASTVLAIASCAVAPSATNPAPTPSSTTTGDESGATVAFKVGRSPVGRYQIALGFRDGRAFRLYWAFPTGAMIGDVVNALAEGLRKKGLEVDVVPEFGTFRIPFTKGLLRAEASGPDDFTFEVHLGNRDELAPAGSRFDEVLSSEVEVVAPVASLRLLRFVEDQYGREGVFELRNLTPDTLYYYGIDADFPCSFEDQEWKNGDRHRENKVTCGNGVSKFSLAPGAVVEFTDLMTEEMFSYLASTRVGVHLSGVPGTLGRGVEVWSEQITAGTK
jgi:hypothetical protein